MNKKHWIILSIAFIIIGILCIIFKGVFNGHEVTVSIIGSLASIFGIIVACIQAYNAKTAAEITKSATEQTKVAVVEGMNQVKKVISLVDISQIMHIPNEIQDTIQGREWSRAFEKMRYLKDFLIEVQNSPFVVDDNKLKREIVESTQKLELRINSFAKGIQLHKDPYAYNKTSELMESIRTQLRTLTTKIKKLF